ncbi:glycine--tRNA ligase subunit beta [Ponticoccus alexandrii]|uniref:Glycine--tRNA ligase beta subunit n=1 Tax=Ponticoccus alexandrii TaxID=1943633 RepID=A0ABX7FBV5_9RHOB|nr:glycine--tRNA ligase subunit beta [Ponticoccus alexandrii]ETA52879.1 glycyl-tRNA synthetase subunit beta [Rhodobacteraceae bacterium PD-2]QRF66852.1 glycine--tRNA ligase subunit beta [Ponticoccus alexandrii]
MPDLLIELFSEEIPARMQARAASDLQKMVTDGLVEAGLTYAAARAFHTPRRLALAVKGLTAHSPTLREERRGPKVGAPEKAIEGFLRGAGVTRDQLEEREEKKGSFYFATVVTEGRPAQAIVAEVLEKTVRGFPWPKSMRWGAGTLRWVRPLHRILCLLSDESGAEVVRLEIDGITAGAETEGHRFLAPGAFTVTGFEDYAAKLKRAFVVLDANERAETIRNDAANAAFAQGLEVVSDEGLLAEVAGLVEWPVVLMGEISEAFLGLPPEVLQTSMKEHQKFFSVKNPKTGRIEKFVTVANVETADNGATILAGNQKVLAARLSDAKFFWDNDLRVAKEEGLEVWTDRLSNVTFHNKLGTQKDRIDRIAALARELAPLVGAEADQAEQAARIAKADLSSEMVYEFPELQGLMGRYYAEAAGLPQAVAAAAQEHYSPLGPSDAVPTAPVSVAVALADKIDTLTGFWAIDEKPTGSKDPYALRRAALGVIRLVLGNGLRVSISQALSRGLTAGIARSPEFLSAVIVRREETTDSGNSFELKLPPWDGFNLDDAKELSKSTESALFNQFIGPWSANKCRYIQDQNEFSNTDVPVGTRALPAPSVITSDLLAFIHDRLKVHLRAEGIPHDVIDACLAMPGSDDLTLLVKRAEAMATVLKTEDGKNLVQGFKRANNILAQAEEKDGVEYSFGADPKFAETDEERALFDALDAADTRIKPAMEAEDFATAMEAMATLRAPIDAFFEAVQVNSDNSVVRRNRLNLLSRIRQTCLQVADLTRIEG